MTVIVSKPLPPPEERREPEPLPLQFRRRTSHVVAKAAVTAAILFLAWHLQWALALIFTAVLVAVFLAAGARGMTHVVGGKGGRGLAAFCVLLVLVGVGFGFLAVPSLLDQSDALAKRLPTIVEEGRGWLEGRSWGDWVLQQFGLGEQSAGDSIKEAVNVKAFSGPAIATLSTGGSLLVYLVFLVFTGLYLAAEPGLYRRGVLWLMPPRQRGGGEAAAESIGHTLTLWLYGQLASMAVVATFTGLGLWILGVPLPFICATFTFFLCFIPNFGPVASVTPPLLLALTASPEDATLVPAGPALALAVAILYLSVQMVESYLLTPMIQKKAVDLPPALLIIAQFVLGLLMGLVGVLIAAPLTAAIMAASKELWIEGDVEHDRPTDGVPGASDPDDEPDPEA